MWGHTLQVEAITEVCPRLIGVVGQLGILPKVDALTHGDIALVGVDIDISEPVVDIVTVVDRPGNRGFFVFKVCEEDAAAVVCEAFPTTVAQPGFSVVDTVIGGNPLKVAGG